MENGRKVRPGANPFAENHPPRQQGNGRQTRFLLADGLGSVRQELAGGDLQTTTTYEPYGKLLAKSGTSGTVYGFTGEQYDAEVGLLYLRARYYNPNLKVFMSVDPFPGWPRVPTSQHSYTYVYNNPANWSDPIGLLTCEAPKAGCAAWVQHALKEIEGVPLPIGRELVQSLWSKDRTLQSIQRIFHAGNFLADCSLNRIMMAQTSMPGFVIKFTDDFRDFGVFDLTGTAAMLVRPTHMKIKLRFYNPPNLPKGDATLLFAHELVHVMQGSVFAFSIAGEILAYQVQSALRPTLDPDSPESVFEREAKSIDLTDPAIRYDYARWLQMWTELESWRNKFPSYKIVPLLPQGVIGGPFTPPPMNPFQPISPPIPAPTPHPSSIPHGTPPPLGTPFSIPGTSPADR